jgi:hypothetical protein
LILIQVNDAAPTVSDFCAQIFRSCAKANMNHHHRKTLHALFAHPIGANVDFGKVMHLLEDVGADVDNKSGNRVGIKLNGHSAAFTHANHSLPKEEVVQVRKFLEACGITPADYPI